MKATALAWCLSAPLNKATSGPASTAMLDTHLFLEIPLVVLGKIRGAFQIAPEEMLAKLVRRGLLDLPLQLFGDGRVNESGKRAALLLQQAAHLGLRLLIQANRCSHVT